MKRAEPQGQPQSAVPPSEAGTNSHNQVIVAGAAIHPVLSCWDINRKLEKLEKNYRDDQEKKPIEIERSSVGNPRCAAIFWRVERLERYVEQAKAVYEKEIESGRFADTPDLWAAVYAVKILPSVAPKIGSLVWSLAHKRWLTGGGEPGEQGTIEEAQRRLSRLRSSLETELARAKLSVPRDDHTELGSGRTDNQIALVADYSTIRFNGRPHSLTKKQSAVVKTLHEQYMLGITQVPKETLKNAMGTFAGAVKDSFKRSPVWGTLVVSNQRPKGTYSLNLSACLPKSSTDDSHKALQPAKDAAKTPLQSA